MSGDSPLVRPTTKTNIYWVLFSVHPHRTRQNGFQTKTYWSGPELDQYPRNIGRCQKATNAHHGAFSTTRGVKKRITTPLLAATEDWSGRSWVYMQTGDDVSAQQQQRSYIAS
jgi:hypothetical protein